MLKELVKVVEGNRVGEGVLSHLFAAEGGQKCPAVESKAQVAGDAADIGPFATADTEIKLGSVGRYFAQWVVVEVVGRREWSVGEWSVGRLLFVWVAGTEIGYFEFTGLFIATSAVIIRCFGVSTRDGRIVRLNSPSACSRAYV